MGSSYLFPTILNSSGIQQQPFYSDSQLHGLGMLAGHGLTGLHHIRRHQLRSAGKIQLATVTGLCSQTWHLHGDSWKAGIIQAPFLFRVTSESSTSSLRSIVILFMWQFWCTRVSLPRSPGGNFRASNDLATEIPAYCGAHPTSRKGGMNEHGFL